MDYRQIKSVNFSKNSIASSTPNHEFIFMHIVSAAIGTPETVHLLFSKDILVKTAG